MDAAPSSLSDSSDVSPADSAEPSVPKPSLYISGDQIPPGLENCTPDETYTALITFRVVGVQAPEQGDHSKTLEVQSLDDVKPAGVSPDDAAETADEAGVDDAAALDVPSDETDTEEATLGYKRPKAKAGAPLDFKKLRS